MRSSRFIPICVIAGFLVVPAASLAGATEKKSPPAGPALEKRIETLERRVRKLESGNVTEKDLVGRYAATIFAVDLTADPRVQTETAVGTFTLNADRTATFSGEGAHCFLGHASTWFVGCDPGQTGSFSGTGTWALQPDGSLAIWDMDGNDVINDPNFIGAGGRVIISGGTVDLSGEPTPEIYSLTMILIRLPKRPLP
jgi:hypothetical protein